MRSQTEFGNEENIFFWFPRAGVGTDRDAPASRLCGPTTFLLRECVPTPARGNEKINALFVYPRHSLYSGVLKIMQFIKQIWQP